MISNYHNYDNFYFYFLENSNLWCPLLVITFYHQIKTLISFWCRRELNFRSLIQLLETLLVELIETQIMIIILYKE